jgi:hypothetical protein
MNRHPHLCIASAACLLLVGVVVSGCSVITIPDESSRTTGLVPIRQTDAQGRRLPFDTVLPHRWSSANDGTDYEPCTALTADELSALGIDPGTVRDAAGTDGQTLRGCDWRYQSSGRQLWGLAQIVGNSPSLAADKSKKSVPTDVWLDDRLIDGRRVGVHHFSSNGDCDTYVQSGRAAINTIVTYNGLPLPPIEDICAKAIEFTEATIGKMPR